MAQLSQLANTFDSIMDKPNMRPQKIPRHVSQYKAIRAIAHKKKITFNEASIEYEERSRVRKDTEPENSDSVKQKRGKRQKSLQRQAYNLQKLYEPKEKKAKERPETEDVKGGRRRKGLRQQAYN